MAEPTQDINDDEQNVNSVAIEITQEITSLEVVQEVKDFNVENTETCITTDSLSPSDDANIEDNENLNAPVVVIDLENELAEKNEKATNDDDIDFQEYFQPYNLKQVPFQMTGSWKEFEKTENNFTRGCKWSPDGSCILTCSDDNILRLFNMPSELYETPIKWEDIAEMDAVLRIPEGERMYDFCWYPFMTSSDPATCCLASSARGSSVHLWDAFTGELRCSYRAYDHADEVVAAHSVCFNADARKLYCGFNKMIRIFDVNTPGREFEERPTFAKKSGQFGIISCFAFSSANQSFSAAGSYGKTIGIYSEPSGFLEHTLHGQKKGVSQLQISPDGTLLYSGGRKDPEILCWDIRNLGSVLFSMRRSHNTNQRLYFDISRCGRYIVSGNQNGVITFWDNTSCPKEVNGCEFFILEPAQYYQAHQSCVNGVSFHPTMPILGSCSGERIFCEPDSGDENDRLFAPPSKSFDHSLRLWWLGYEEATDESMETTVEIV